MWHQVVDPPGNLPAGTVFLDARPSGGSFPAVVPDEHGGAVAAVEELIRHGHRRIAYLGSGEPPVPIATGLRRDGYLHALQAAGIDADPDLDVEVPITTAAGGVEAAGALLDLPAERRPTAIFCFNDRVAMGTYRAARHRGLQIPRDLSVVGYDDQQYIAEALDPPLTTVALPHYEMGQWAMEVMLGLREPPTGDGVALMPCPLVRRDSVSPPPATLRGPTGDGD
jgi:LacI family transcriptional regulator